MIDGGIIAGYLAAAAARGGKRLLDGTVDAALDRLTGAVAGKLGYRPGAMLEPDPGDPGAQQQVAAYVADAARRDERFAHKLAEIQDQLDRAGARPLLNQVQGVGINAQHFGHGDVHVGDYYSHHSSHDYDPGDELVIGRGVGRLLAVIGLLVALAGFAGWMWLIFTGFDAGGDPFSKELVPGLPLAPAAFLAFLGGGLLYGLGTSMSKAARKRLEQGQRRGARHR